MFSIWGSHLLLLRGGVNSPEILLQKIMFLTMRVFMRSNSDFDEIQNILNRLFKKYKLHQPMEDNNLFLNWSYLVGHNIADYFHPKYIENGVLYVEKTQPIDIPDIRTFQDDLFLLIKQMGHKSSIAKVKII